LNGPPVHPNREPSVQIIFSAITYALYHLTITDPQSLSTTSYRLLEYIVLGMCAKGTYKASRPVPGMLFHDPILSPFVEGELDFWAYDDWGGGANIGLL